MTVRFSLDTGQDLYLWANKISNLPEIKAKGLMIDLRPGFEESFQLIPGFKFLLFLVNNPNLSPLFLSIQLHRTH